MRKVKVRNILLILIVTFLCLFGMLMIYSASFYSSEILYGDKFYFVKKQLFGFALGIVLFLIAYKFDYHKYYKLRYYILGLSILLLVLVFIFVSCYLCKNYEKTKTFKGILPILLVGGVICLLVILEPNMSVTMCIGMVMIIMLIIGGMSFKHFAILSIGAFGKNLENDKFYFLFCIQY